MIHRARSPQKVIIFTRIPVPDKTKTRMIPLLGAEGAAQLQREMLEFILSSIKPYCEKENLPLEIRFADGPVREMESWLGKGLLYRPQGAGDLGERMRRAMVESKREGSEQVVMIGGDCPLIDGKVLQRAFSALKKHTIVIGPSNDGGYYLIGMNKLVPDIFEKIDWGTERVYGQTMEKVLQLNLSVAVLDKRPDIDRPEDYEVWKSIKEKKLKKEELPDLSIIIPVWNEEELIERTLKSATGVPKVEVLVVDGGSTDSTCEIAKKFDVIVLKTDRPGRAYQMNFGARRARGRILLFLHGDTSLPENFHSLVKKALDCPSVSAGAFRFGLDETFIGSSMNIYFANLRAKLFQWPYGDQGLFMKREIFRTLEGFREIPIMEDVDMIRRLRQRGRIVIIPEQIRTSSRRWRRLGYMRTFLINQLLLAAFLLGLSPERLARWYDRKTKPDKESL